MLNIPKQVFAFKSINENVNIVCQSTGIITSLYRDWRKWINVLRTTHCGSSIAQSISFYNKHQYLLQASSQVVTMTIFPFHCDFNRITTFNQQHIFCYSRWCVLSTAASLMFGWFLISYNILYFYPLIFQADGVLSLPAPVRLSVCLCLSVCKLYLFRTITRHRFELESPNLHQTCIMGYSRLVLKIGVIDFDLQGHSDHFDSEFLEFRVVRAITFKGLELESPNLHQICILEFS